MKKVVSTLLLAALVVSLTACGGGEVKKVENPSSASAEAAAEKSESKTAKEDKVVFKSGETAELNGVKVTLAEVKESKGSEFVKPKDGHVFLLPTFEIENGSDKELNISSMMSFEAYVDGYATNLDISALTEKDGEQLDGKVAPGKKMKGVVGYDVPADYKELEIKFKADLLGKEITFKYTK